MTTLYFKTNINAEKKAVFNIARNLDFHKDSLAFTKEKIIAGKLNDYIEEGETVTWRGKHFGIYLTHQSRITQMEKYNYFTDAMEKGHFKHFIHHHEFIKEKDTTIMLDIIHYATPYGWLGKILNFLILKRYLRRWIEKRNTQLKLQAEKTT